MYSSLRVVAHPSCKNATLHSAEQMAIISALEAMLAKARTGQLTGLLYMAKVGKSDQGVHVIGDYRSDPKACLVALESSLPPLRQLLLARND